MNRRTEDKAAKLAFGEMSPEQAERARRKVGRDPKTRAMLRDYSELRDGLKSLADIPDDQFSHERLRDAILTRGLKPAPLPKRSNQNWLWMPAAASMMGFVLMYAVQIRHRHVGTPQVVVNMPKDYRFGGEFAPKVSSAASVAETKATEVPPSNAASAISAGEPVSYDGDDVDPRITASNLSVAADDGAFDPDLGTAPMSSPSNRPTSRMVASATLSSRSGNMPGRRDFRSSGIRVSDSLGSLKRTEPLVLIESDKDEQTGACRATEVGSTSNVLVGG